jgi:hypothetical protein
MLTWVLQQNAQFVDMWKIEKTIISLGYNVISIPYNIGKPIETPTIDGIAVAYGSSNFCRRLTDKKIIVYDMNSNCTEYYPLFKGDDLLNSDYVMVLFGDFIRRKDYFLDMFNGEVFLRPNKGSKTFTGLVVNRDNYSIEINTLLQCMAVPLDELVLLSSVKHIEEEYRFFIAGEKVVSQSYYDWNDGTKTEIPSRCMELAVKVANSPIQKDLCYSVDIAVTNVGIKIIEMNSFSYAGLYECNIHDTFKAVSLTTLENYSL